MVHTWYSSLAHLRQRLCRQGRITTGFVNTSRQMGQMSCFSRVPIEGSLWSERISSGRDMAVCPRWPLTHWKTKLGERNHSRGDETPPSPCLCAVLMWISSLSRQRAVALPQSSNGTMGAWVGLQLEMCACARRGRCLVSCWLTDQLCPFQAASGMLGNIDDALSPVTPIIHVLSLKTSQQSK